MKHVVMGMWNRLVPFVLLFLLLPVANGQSLENQSSSLSTNSFYQQLSVPNHQEVAPAPEATGMGEPTSGTVTIDAQWDLQFAYSASDTLGLDGIAGAYWTGTEFWVSKWNSDTMATLNVNGSVIQIFTIPGVTGVRSITSDGTNLFLGTANASITEVNPVTKTLVNTIAITGAGAAIGSRFLTYDPTLDAGNGGFYIGNFNSDIATISMTGATLGTIPFSTHGRAGIYGAAYDGISTGGPYLWVFHQSGNPSNAVISQLQLPAGTWTGVSYDVDANLGLPGALAGGLFLATDIVTGQNTIGGMAQGTPNTLFGLELDFQIINVDAHLADALPDPLFSHIPLLHSPSIDFEADISNYGQQPLASASLDVDVVNLATNTSTFTSSSSPVAINPLQSSAFSVGPWTPADTGVYEVSLSTNTGPQVDQVPSNDSSSFLITVTDSVLGIDQGPSIGNYGVGAGANQNAFLATRLTLLTSDSLTSVTAFFGTPPAGQTVFYNIYPALSSGNPSQVPLASTVSYTFTASDAANGVALTLPIAGGKIELPAGDFFIGIAETSQNVSLVVTEGLYKPGNVWFKADIIGAGNWNSASQEVVLAIRANFAEPIPPTLSFESDEISVPEDTGSFQIFMTITNPFSTPTTVQANVGNSSATQGVDFLVNLGTLTFPGGSSDSIGITIDILDDGDLESLEFFEIVLSNPSNGGSVSPFDTIRVNIVDDEIPFYDIATLTNDSNSDGLADSLTVSAEIRGIVYGVNLSASGLQFTLIDSTDGIQVFSFNVVDNYVVAEGDSLHVWGTVGQFNGLAQFEPDSIQLISQGNPLKPASLQILPGEKDESRLIVINCVTLVDATAWPADGDNANLEVRNGVDTFIVRIDKETNLDGSPAPMGWFNITGIGGQFDNSPPFTSGYQLFPRYAEDIESLPALQGEFALAMDQLDESTGSYSFDFRVKNGVPDTANISLRVGASSTATEITDFTLDAFSSDFVGCGDSATYSGMLTIVDDTDIEGDETVEIILEASIAGNIVVADTLTITITETDNIFDGTADLGISIYPNPGSHEVIISAEERILSVELLDMTGRVLASKAPNTVEESFDTDALPAGVYSLRVETGKGIGTYRWIKR